jgi:hypothetical protein
MKDEAGLRPIMRGISTPKNTGASLKTQITVRIGRDNNELYK